MQACTPEYVRDRDLATRYGVDRVTIWRWACNGTLPQPIKLTPGTTRWRVADILAHEAARAG